MFNVTHREIYRSLELNSPLNVQCDTPRNISFSRIELHDSQTGIGWRLIDECIPEENCCGVTSFSLLGSQQNSDELFSFVSTAKKGLRAKKNRMSLSVSASFRFSKNGKLGESSLAFQCGPLNPLPGQPTLRVIHGQDQGPCSQLVIPLGHSRLVTVAVVAVFQ